MFDSSHINYCWEVANIRNFTLFYCRSISSLSSFAWIAILYLWEAWMVSIVAWIIAQSSVESLNKLFSCHRLLGDAEDAVKSLTKAVDILRITHGTSTPFMKDLFRRLEEARAEAFINGVD